MDIASLVGLIGACGMIIGAMLAGGSLGPFVDTASILIVIGGTFFAVMYQATLPTFLGHFGAMGKTFFPPVKKMEDMIERMVELAAMARKDGMMALEGQETPDKFFAKGMQLLVDGADEAKLVGQMEADLAPTMGMIGTLVGLVIMLGNMSDPASIGPAMAVALLTTMYGAIIANVLFMPMLTKLENYSSYEVVYRQTVILGLRGIARGESPRNMQDQMVSLLAPKAQEKFEAAA